MRKLVLSVLTVCTLFLAGCFETTQEITLNEDGSGTISNTNDMGPLIALAKNMGAADQMEKAGMTVIDSTVSMKEGADSIPNLTPEEREMVRKGTLTIKANLKEDKFMTNLSFPFNSPSQIPVYTKLSGKIMAEVMKEKMSDNPAPGADQMPEASSFDDYYTLEFSNGELTRKVNKDKYAGVESDEYLKGIKEAATMGLTMKATYIINLPRPATKAEGKNVKLSENKKKVTISADIEDFFADASVLEFKIKY
ncbi:MAG TPA: hypothetical protein VGO58_02315 [Chitinophagaceae bacterium]|jgi:hypothetical protein|nr:hypothetical protein [Chitinophagaceae bacterium]